MDVLTIAVPVGTGLFGVAAAWGTMVNRVSTITRKLTEHEERLKAHDLKFEDASEGLHKREIEIERLKSRANLLEHGSDESVIKFDKLELETREQTEMLMDIQRRLGRVATPSQGFRVPGPSPVPPRPPALPPVRPRQKSYRSEAG